MKHSDGDRRPYPPPSRLWALRMTWYDLLFAHWAVPPRSLETLLPKPLELDTFNGEAWLSIVPFGMRDVAPCFVPAIPGVSAFLELNVRTYVTLGGKPGVWFFSLDASSRLAVRGARLSFHLPYFDAVMSMDRTASGIGYSSVRTHKRASPASWRSTYRATGEVYYAQPGSLDEWLTSRWCLYSANARGTVFRGEIDHEPWPLQTAEAEIGENTMTAQIGLELPPSRPLLHYAKEVKVIGWLLETAAKDGV